MGPSVLNMHSWSPADGDTASHAVSRRSTHSLPTFPLYQPHTHTRTHNFHGPHPATTMKLALTLDWAAADASRMRQGWDWEGGHTQVDRKKDQLKTTRELLTLSWVRPNRLNLLTHYPAPLQGLPVWPQHLFPKKGARCGGDEKPAWVSPPFHRQFPLIHPAFSGSLMDVLTHLPQASGTPSPPPLPIWSSTSRCVNGLIPPASYNQATQKVLDQVELVNSGT